MKLALPRVLARHAILLLMACAMLALAFISLGGMSTSVLVGESVRGSASAINHAGALRRLAHRAASLGLARAGSAAISATELEEALADFDRLLVHEELQRIVEREPGGLFAAIHRGVEAAWHARVRPRLQRLREQQPVLGAQEVASLLGEIDAFVEQLNSMVHVLEQETEARIRELGQILAASILATLVVIAVVLLLVRKALLKPLRSLLVATRALVRGDYSARVAHVGDDELGRLGAAFNLMASEISQQYQTLEERVANKTAALQRSNQALELLYHAIGRLYQAPTDPAVYQAILADIEQGAGLGPCTAWIEAEPSAASSALAIAASTRARQAAVWARGGEDEGSDPPRLLRFALRDREHVHGSLCLSLPSAKVLEDWQRQLVEALSRHIGVALGAARRAQQERLLVLQEERSAIARELHDSLAQSLSYMKIQVSLLQRTLLPPLRLDEAEAVVADLRSGLNEAYRQLRELLVSFRLELEGDLASLLRGAAAEYGERGGIEIEVDIDQAACRLTANEEVHVLQIVREALSNMVRHANARQAFVGLGNDDAGQVRVVVEDDGVGFAETALAGHGHHGLAIMDERARQLGGRLAIEARVQGGTRVTLEFRPAGGVGEPRPAVMQGQPR